jgi:hypothetical protein
LLLKTGGMPSRPLHRLRRRRLSGIFLTINLPRMNGANAHGGPNPRSPVPTVLIVGPYRFSFFATDRSEPPHIHAIRGTQVAKFWLSPVRLAKNKGFAEHELNAVERLVVQYEARFLEAWRDYFGP